MTKNRRQSSDPLERYYTPKWVTRALVRYCPELQHQHVIEPCAGRRDISNVLREGAFINGVQSFDIAPAPGVFRVEAADTLKPDFWERRTFHPRCAVVENPPFSGGATLFKLAHGSWIQPSVIALLVRLSWLERVADRADVPDPDRLIILPRPQFIESDEARAIREAAGKKWGGDSVTCAWSCWFRNDEHNWPGQFTAPIIRVSRREKAVLEVGPLDLEAGTP